MATVPDLITETQGLLKKAAKATANTTDVVRWFNDLRRRLQQKAQIKRRWTVSLVKGTTTYSLAIVSYPIYQLTRAEYTPTGSAEKLPIDILPPDAEEDTGVRFQPALPGETNHTLTTYPDTLDGTLYLHGTLRMATLTDDAASIPEIDEAFHDLYPLWAAARYGGQDEDFLGDGRYANFMREFMEREREFLNAQLNPRKGPRFIKPRRW